MSELKPDPGSNRRNAVSLLAALIPITFVILVVNFWIYYARYLYIRRHPVESVELPPTISKAISDPAIGDPFAVWISTSAILLFVACILLARFKWMLAESLPEDQRRIRFQLKAAFVGVVLFQLLTSIGMIMLSWFPLSRSRDLHMLGSYIFFISQAISILLMTLISARLKQDSGARAIFHREHGIASSIWAIRTALGCISVFLALMFALLFVVKDFDLEHKRQVQQVYVLAEPALISSFLLVLASYYVDLIGSYLRRRSRTVMAADELERSKRALSSGQMRKHRIEGQA
jgi:hypothetical protein